MGQSVASRMLGFLGLSGSPSKSSRSRVRQAPSDQVPLLNRGAKGERRSDLSRSSLYGQIDAGPLRNKEVVQPADSKHFPEFAKSATVYDMSTDLYFDASKVPPEIFKDVCQGAPIAAMHAIAKPLRNCGKSMYAQICNHSERPWNHRWLERGAPLGEASDLEKAQARAVLERYLPGKEVGGAVTLLFASVNADGDAIWVDFQQFNEGLGQGKSLPDPQLQDLVASLSTCLKSFVDRRKAQSWNNVYILYPVDAKLRLQ